MLLVNCLLLIVNRLEPHSGDIPQPWVLTHGKQKYQIEPRSGGITQPWVKPAVRNNCAYP